MVCVGQESAQIKDIMLVSKSKKIVNVTLSLACNQKAESWLQFMSENSDTEVSMKAAEFPLFSLLKELKTRILIGIIL